MHSTLRNLSTVFSNGWKRGSSYASDKEICLPANKTAHSIQCVFKSLNCAIRLDVYSKCFTLIPNKLCTNRKPITSDHNGEFRFRFYWKICHYYASKQYNHAPVATVAPMIPRLIGSLLGCDLKGDELALPARLEGDGERAELDGVL